MIQEYQQALESGNIVEAVRLANLIDWVAIAPKIERKPIDTTAADNAMKTSKRGAWVEGAILRRQERFDLTW